MIEKADKRLHSVTVAHIKGSNAVWRAVEKILYDEGYALVLPPDNPKLGDQFLGNGTQWHPVTEGMYAAEKPFCLNSFIVRRPTEHQKMLWFFFGRPESK